MSVNAIGEYRFDPKDKLENFHGNQLVYVHWEKHLSICSPVCFPLPPDMPFGALMSEILPAAYAKHPEWEKVDLGQVKWVLDGQPFAPDPGKGLKEQGIGHKSVIRFNTPGLNGWKGSAS